MSFGSGRGLSRQRIMSNRVVHLELHTTDLARACAFYERVCGWRPEQIHAGGGSYTALELGDRVGGGVVECGTPRSLWLPYVAVDDVADGDPASGVARGVGAARSARGTGRLAQRRGRGIRR